MAYIFYSFINIPCITCECNKDLVTSTKEVVLPGVCLSFCLSATSQ